MPIERFTARQRPCAHVPQGPALLHALGGVPV